MGKILSKFWNKTILVIPVIAAFFIIVDYFIKWRVSSYIFSVIKDLCGWIISRPNYGSYSLCSLIILIIVIITLLIKWWYLHLTYERFENKLGVLWDKKKRMHCINCHKLLKYSTQDSLTFFCSDPKCDNKHCLKDETGNSITEKQAIEKMENNT